MISVSSLSSYLYCARKLFLTSVLHFVEPPKEVMVRGTVSHLAYELVNNAEQELISSIKTAEAGEIAVLYKNQYARFLRQAIIRKKRELARVQLHPAAAFEQLWPAFFAEAKTRAGNVHRFIELNRVFGSQLWEQIVPKIRSEYNICSANLQLRGIIDQIAVYPNHMVPIEIKTGTAPDKGVWDSHRVQLTAYAMLIEDLFKTEVKNGLVRYVDAGKEEEIIMNPFLREEVRQLIKNVQNLMQSSEPPDFCMNRQKCDSCGLKRFCCDNKFISAKTKHLNRPPGNQLKGEIK